LQEKVRQAPAGKKYDIDLTYITSRGKWYSTSWKGDVSKSGGIATNIGVHFFDMLIWIFGGVRHHEVHVADDRRMAGFLELEKAQVRWFLSVGKEDLPPLATQKGKATYRSITVDGEEIEFSGGFTDLHTVVYREILSGRGFGVEETRPSIDLVYKLRNSVPVHNDISHAHPLSIKP
jgi:UDP-N-acetyl-2-amino-2-deoxyglucuronate dehydrogenase